MGIDASCCLPCPMAEWRYGEGVLTRRGVFGKSNRCLTRCVARRHRAQVANRFLAGRGHSPPLYFYTPLIRRTAREDDTSTLPEHMHYTRDSVYGGESCIRGFALQWILTRLRLLSSSLLGSNRINATIQSPRMICIPTYPVHLPEHFFSSGAGWSSSGVRTFSDRHIFIDVYFGTDVIQVSSAPWRFICRSAGR